MASTIRASPAIDSTGSIKPCQRLAPRCQGADQARELPRSGLEDHREARPTQCAVPLNPKDSDLPAMETSPAPRVLAVSAVSAGEVSEAVGGPGRTRILFVGLATLVEALLVTVLQLAPLAHDKTFGSVLYLMWSANVPDGWVPLLLGSAIHLMAATVPLFLIAWAIVWPTSDSPRAVAIVRWCYRFAPCWPLLLFVSTVLPRIIANAVYALAPFAASERTPLLARLEGPLLERLQAALENPTASAFFAGVYSLAWIMAVSGLGPWLALRGRDRVLSQVIVGPMLVSMLALPFFLLIPIFDPWTTNPIYAYGGEGQTAVRYLFPHADATHLSAIVTGARWATGSCLPSVHIALPLLFFLILMKHRMRLEATVLAAVTVATSAAVVYLGRHWIIDVVLAVPFAMGVHWLLGRINPKLHLTWEHNGRRGG